MPSIWQWYCMDLSVLFCTSISLSRDISPKMKHFLRNFRGNLAKVTPHLVESQVSLREILSPGVSLSLRVRTYILAIQEKISNLGLQDLKNFHEKFPFCHLLAVCPWQVPQPPRASVSPSVAWESPQSLSHRVSMRIRADMKVLRMASRWHSIQGSLAAMIPCGNPVKLPTAGSLALFSQPPA